MDFSGIYPLYVAKAERKGRTKGEVDEIIRWISGYSQKELEAFLECGGDVEAFLTGNPRPNPARSEIKGVVCGVRVEEIEDPLMNDRERYPLIRLRYCILSAPVLWALLFLFSCTSRTVPQPEAPSEPVMGEIYLYGEMHGVGKILDREFTLWQNHYEKEGMRHLFVELPFYTAEFLNQWLHTPDDEILDALWEDARGTAGNTAEAKEFYKRIKEKCPETVFHGTDVGHQYDNTGERFLEKLRDSGQEKTELYGRAVEAIEQGREYYLPVKNPVYRENTMVQNFIGEYDRLGGENVMGIYGSAHTNLDSLNHTGEVPCMATQLNERYSPRIHSEDLSELVKIIDPVGRDYFLINGKEYRASYFGRQDLSGFRDYSYREFWRLEEAYRDFARSRKTGDNLPYDNYPMALEAGQVFRVLYGKTDGSCEVLFYRSDGKMWKGRKNTVGIDPE